MPEAPNSIKRKKFYLAHTLAGSRTWSCHILGFGEDLFRCVTSKQRRECVEEFTWPKGKLENKLESHIPC
jgi:hypothetical protein